MKVCSRCGIEKHEDQFYWNSRPNGKKERRPDCKVCFKNHSTRAKNNEANAAYMRTYRKRKKAEEFGLKPSKRDQ